jgi:hypothetical protein
VTLRSDGEKSGPAAEVLMRLTRNAWLVVDCLLLVGAVTIGVRHAFPYLLREGRGRLDDYPPLIMAGRTLFDP